MPQFVAFFEGLVDVNSIIGIVIITKLLHRTISYKKQEMHHKVSNQIQVKNWFK